MRGLEAPSAAGRALFGCREVLAALYMPLECLVRREEKVVRALETAVPAVEALPDRLVPARVAELVTSWSPVVRVISLAQSEVEVLTLDAGSAENSS